MAWHGRGCCRQGRQAGLLYLVADDGLGRLCGRAEVAASPVVRGSQQLGGNLAVARGIEDSSGRDAGEPGERLAVGEKHPRRGEPVPTGMRALPHRAWTLRGGLEGNGPTAHGAADVPPGVGADQQNRAG